ncbi:RICIN domain-containing protein [Actinomadura geliboluensis]|uniref:RICIN domain-containing protein n=1 Tax=Actinomadura geliboluensis TaxID=882440 RepID=UPI0036C09046
MLTTRDGQGNRPRRRLGRAAAGAAAVAASTGALTFVAPATAHADSIHWFNNQATGRCFNWPNSNCAYPENNKINVHPWRDGTYELKWVRGGNCFDDSDAYGFRLFQCNSSKFQSWYLHRWNDGTTQIKNQATGRCVDDSFAYGLRTYACNSTEFQSWFGW